MKKLSLKSKILIIVLICLLSAILPIAIVSIVNYIKPINPPHAADYYVDNAHKSIDIYNLAGLKYFMSNNKTYANYDISIHNDINCNNEAMSWKYTTPYSGSFNGNNHTISNLIINGLCHDMYIDTDSFSGATEERKAFGFFASINNAEIKNLKFLNVKYDTYHTSYGDWKYIGMYVGGIVGYANSGTIENCIIENFSAVPPKNRADNNVGGIIGVGTATIRNCIVKNFTTTATGTIAKIGPTVLRVSIWDHYDWVSNSDISSNIINNAAGSMISINSTKDCYETKSSSYTYSGLTSDYWFIPKTDEYNKGWPMLKSFIQEWRKYNVTTADRSQGSVNESSFSVPWPSDSGKDYSDIPKDGETYGNFSVGVINLGVNTTPATGYVFKDWTVDGTNITANFELIRFWVNINVINPMTGVEDYNFALFDIYYEYDDLTFKDMNNEATDVSTDPDYFSRIPPGTNIKISNVRVVGTGGQIYTFDKVIIGTGTGSIKDNKDGSFTYTATEQVDQSIFITFKLKEYDIEIG